MHLKFKKEHDGVVEISIRNVKLCVERTCHYVPYIKYEKLMTGFLVEGVIYLLNEFPSKNVVSNAIGTAVIVLGIPQQYFNRKK